MSVRITRGGAVDCRAALEIPLSATAVWGQLRDFHRYAQQDFFHAELMLETGFPKAGARLTLCHRYAGIRVNRIGRILVWREGIGYSFSDLSKRGPRAGFPHIFSFRIEPTAENSCRLHIRVRGLWTAKWIPVWAVKLWLIWVFAHVVRRIDNEIMIYRIWRKRNNKSW
jgi:hypothetical protein